MHLADYLCELCLIYFHTIPAQPVGRKSRTLLLSYRRKLRRIPYQHQAATCPAIYILNQVIQQTACTKDRPRQSVIGDHRCLIHNKQSMLMQVIIQRKVVQIIRKVTLAVNFLMNRIGRMLCIMRKNFGRPACRSKQDTLLL